MDKDEPAIRLEPDTIAGLIMPMRENKDRMVLAKKL